MKTGRKFWLAVIFGVLLSIIAFFAIQKGLVDSGMIQTYFMMMGIIASIAIGGNVGEHFVKGMTEKIRLENGNSESNQSNKTTASQKS